MISLLSESWWGFKFKTEKFEQDLQVYIQDLLGRVNRGDSIKVNGNMYNFILKLEEVVR